MATRRIKKLIILRGLPGSLKSTKAKEILETNRNAFRVNKDLLREMFHITIYDSSREKIVVDTEYQLVEFLLSLGKDVIVDDTNFNEVHINKYKEIASLVAAQFEIIDMINDVEECIARDLKRSKTYIPMRSVGANTITSMAIKYGLLKQLKPIVVFNIDILGDSSHRTHLVHSDFITRGEAKANWREFFLQSIDDPPINSNIQMCNEYSANGYEIILVSGTPNDYRAQKFLWLKRNKVKFDRLLMRADGDYSQDPILKKKMLNNYMAKDMVEIWVDDRKTVIDVIKAEGISIIDKSNGVSY